MLPLLALLVIFTERADMFNTYWLFKWTFFILLTFFYNAFSVFTLMSGLTFLEANFS